MCRTLSMKNLVLFELFEVQLPLPVQRKMESNNNKSIYFRSFYLPRTRTTRAVFHHNHVFCSFTVRMEKSFKNRHNFFLVFVVFNIDIEFAGNNCSSSTTIMSIRVIPVLMVGWRFSALLWFFESDTKTRSIGMNVKLKEY